MVPPPEVLKFVLTEPVFESRTAFWLGSWDERNAGQWLKRVGLWSGEGNLDAPDDARGLCLRFSGGGNLIWMPEPPDCVDKWGTLVHEIVHAVAFMGDQKGFKLHSDSEEFYTYMSGWLFREAMKRIGYL